MVNLRIYSNSLFFVNNKVLHMFYRPCTDLPLGLPFLLSTVRTIVCCVKIPWQSQNEFFIPLKREGHLVKIQNIVFERGQSTLVMTFDLNLMGYIYQMKGNFRSCKWRKLYVIKLIVLKVMVEQVQRGKPKFGEKLTFWLALILKPYNILR